MKKNSCYLFDSFKYLTENARWDVDIALHLACEASQLEKIVSVAEQEEISNAS